MNEKVEGASKSGLGIKPLIVVMIVVIASVAGILVMNKCSMSQSQLIECGEYPMMIRQAFDQHQHLVFLYDLQYFVFGAPVIRSVFRGIV